MLSALFFLLGFVLGIVATLVIVGGMFWSMAKTVAKNKSQQRASVVGITIPTDTRYN